MHCIKGRAFYKRTNAYILGLILILLIFLKSWLVEWLDKQRALTYEPQWFVIKWVFIFVTEIAFGFIPVSYTHLYVPVTQLDMVSKYIGPREDASVKLNRLGGTEWQKTKARVRTAVKDMAKELIKLYADRMQAKGHAFSQDNEWQRDFESHFEFDETEDQLRCIEEIKNDMEREAPMDRLLCGDVGFGKTEVALRARCV